MKALAFSIIILCSSTAIAAPVFTIDATVTFKQEVDFQDSSDDKPNDIIYSETVNRRFGLFQDMRGLFVAVDRDTSQQFLGHRVYFENESDSRISATIFEGYVVEYDIFVGASYSEIENLRSRDPSAFPFWSDGFYIDFDSAPLSITNGNIGDPYFFNSDRILATVESGTRNGQITFRTPISGITLDPGDLFSLGASVSIEGGVPYNMPFVYWDELESPPAVVPLPGAMLSMLIGIASLAWSPWALRRRRRVNAATDPWPYCLRRYHSPVQRTPSKT